MLLVSMAGNDHGVLERFVSVVYSRGGKACTGLGRAGYLGGNYGHVRGAIICRGLAPVGPKQGALLGNSIRKWRDYTEQSRQGG